MDERTGAITDPGDFDGRIRRSFEQQGAMGLIGAELTRVQPAMVEIEFPYDPKLTQQHGFLHAGMISAALETACTYAAYSVIAPDVSILTIEFKVNLLSPGRGERFLFAARSPSPVRRSSWLTAAPMRSVTGRPS